MGSNSGFKGLNILTFI